MTSVSIFSSIESLAILVDQTRDVTNEKYSQQSTGRFITNNWLENWFTTEFVIANQVNVDDYIHMPRYDEQITLRFIGDSFYVENLYFKFLSGWFIAHKAHINTDSKAFVSLFMQNDIKQSNIYLMVNHNGELIEIY